MNRLQVCQECDACTSKSPLKCGLITKQVITGTVECPRLLMAKIFGREQSPCPHPNPEQREKFANAEIPKPANDRPKREPMSAVDAKLRDKLRGSPHTRRHALSVRPKQTFRESANPAPDRIG